MVSFGKKLVGRLIAIGISLAHKAIYGGKFNTVISSEVERWIRVNLISRHATAQAVKRLMVSCGIEFEAWRV